MKLTDRARATVADLRNRSPLVDHAVRTQEHYTAVQGSQQAGGMTYFGFLSTFPILALAFFAVGLIARIWPGAEDDLLTAVDAVLPGLVSDRAGGLSLDDIERTAGRVGLIGLVGVLYAGLGWLSSLRAALATLFTLPLGDRPTFVRGKLRDLVTLAVLGAVLFLSVVLSGVVTRLSGDLLDLIGLGRALGWVVTILALVLGVAIGTLLFFLMFRLLADPPLPPSSLWAGALVGAIGFELLKQLSGLLLTMTRGQPAFQAFGISLILLVWINYFSRVVLYGAAWSFTDPVETDRSITANPREGEPS